MSKTSTNRRHFIGMAGFGLAAACARFSRFAYALGSADADLIVSNARIYTVDDAQPTASAFAIKNGRFVAVGKADDILAMGGPNTLRLDAAGATIVPGFNDAHLHAEGQTLLYEVNVGNPFEVEFVTIDSIIQKLRKKAEETPDGFWVEGFFYDDTKVKDGRLINRLDLDKVSTKHPVRVRHRGGHTSFYNSRAFELAGVDANTADPPGGEYFRDANGLTGRVAERANAVIYAAGKKVEYTSTEKASRARAGAAHFSQVLVRYGVTSVQTSTRQFGDLDALQYVHRNGELRHRVSFEVAGDLLEAMIANGIRTGFGDEWLRLGATAENTVDGSLSERTARLSQGYPGIDPPYYGIMTQSQDELNAWAERVHRAGIRLNCHANGDVGIDAALKAYERALQLSPVPDARPKITHCSIVNDDLLRRMKAIGAVPATFTTYTYYNSDKFPYYGKEIMNRALPFRSFIDWGITAAAGSDYPPGPFAPLMGIQGLVTRKGWDGKVWGEKQRVSVAEALRIHTLNGAYCSHEEQDKGSITPGKLADFVMLSEDPHSLDPEKILGIKVLKTYTGGHPVYEA